MIRVEKIDNSHWILTDDTEVFFQHEKGGDFYRIGMTQDKKIPLAIIDEAYQKNDVAKGKYHYFYAEQNGDKTRLDSDDVPTMLHAKGTKHQKSFFKPKNGQFLTVYPKMVSYDYKFSIIMAVYGVEEYLAEAVDSVLNQTEQSVQLILVNDGSPDGSGEIAKQYAKDNDNVIYLEQENQGVSAARNLGMTVATGEFWNFMDPDDTLSEDTLENVYKFFKPRKHLTDVVNIPIYFFGDREGEHPLNAKFQTGSHVINLLAATEKEIALSLSTSFMSKEAIEKMTLDTSLKVGEDMMLINTIMLDKLTLGVVSEAAYNYRRISGFGALSGTQTRMTFEETKARFLIHETLAQKSIEKYGTVVNYLQLVMIYDLSWQLKSEKFLNAAILTEEEQNILIEKHIYGVFEKYIDFQLIQNSTMLSMVVKEYLTYRIGISRKQKFVENNFGVWVNSFKTFAFNDIKATFVTANVDNSIASLYFEISTPALMENIYSNTDIKMSIHGKKIHANRIEENNANSRAVLGEYLTKSNIYRFDLALNNLKNLNKQIILVMTNNDTKVTKKIAVNFNKHEFSSLSKDILIDSISEDFVSKIDNGNLMISRKGELENIQLLDAAFGANSEKKCEFLVAKKNKDKPIFLFEDRPSAAGDNAEALFKYVVKNHPEVDAYFVLHKDSEDWERLSAIGQTLDKFSDEHVKVWAISDVIFSSHAEYQIFNPVSRQEEDNHKDYFKTYRILNKPAFVFLQHGISRSSHHINKWLNLTNKNIKMLVTTAKYEQTEFLTEPYHYSEKVVKQVGMPRLDALLTTKKKTEKVILFMPTWRKNLNIMNDEQFVRSAYFTQVMDFLTDKRLQKTLTRESYEIAFKIHPNLLRFIHLFDLPKNVHFSEESYKDLYEKSAIALTDFSSAVLDFAYMKKPVVQYQFDHLSYFEGHIFDKDDDSEVEQAIYAPIFTNDKYDDFVSEVISKMKNPVMDKEYQDKIDSDFPMRDGKNSERVFNAVWQELN